VLVTCFYLFTGAATGPLAPPKMARNRFSREELLALYQTIDLDDVPAMLLTNFAEFVTAEAQRPITLTQFSETEEV
jgi:hypothetical protein